MNVSNSHNSFGLFTFFILESKNLTPINQGKTRTILPILTWAATTTTTSTTITKTTIKMITVKAFKLMKCKGICFHAIPLPVWLIVSVGIWEWAKVKLLSACFFSDMTYISYFRHCCCIQTKVWWLRWTAETKQTNWRNSSAKESWKIYI